MAAETIDILVISAVVSAGVGGLVTYFTQNSLLTKKAELDYQYEAKKRIHEATGPASLQLMLSARDIIRRFHKHHKDSWAMEPEGYYVKSSIYLLLAPLAVGQTIEKRIGMVDFTIDSEALIFLKFITTAERMLSGSDPLLDHPNADWSNQTQHLFRHNLRSAAPTLIVTEEGDNGRIMGFDEFDSQYEIMQTENLKDLGLLFKNCDEQLTENSILWIRIVGYMYSCSKLLNSKTARSLGFTARELDITEMV